MILSFDAALCLVLGNCRQTEPREKQELPSNPCNTFPEELRGFGECPLLRMDDHFSLLFLSNQSNEPFFYYHFNFKTFTERNIYAHLFPISIFVKSKPMIMKSNAVFFFVLDSTFGDFFFFRFPKKYIRDCLSLFHNQIEIH